ncbi:MAG: beta-propeller domain-containing protein [Myxococcota bacterium]|nr:beta-propeller domain-containing protein [Myxococcota bacterium]
MDILRRIVRATSQMGGILLLCAGCYEVAPTDRNIQPVEVNHALVQMDSCEQYLDYAKETAIQRMRVLIERQCQQMLDGVSDNDGWDWINGVDEETSGGDVDGDADADADGDGTFSETNVQEEGVDEADIVKTDGEHIYALSGNGFVIVSIDEAGNLTEVGRTKLDGNPVELFIYGDLAVVFSGLEDWEVPDAIALPDAPQYPDFDGPDIDIDFDGSWYGSWYTAVQIVDISDKTAPALSRSTMYAGRYVSSRRVSNALRTVLSSPLPALEVPTMLYVDYWDMSANKARKRIHEACDALIAKNIETINAVTVDAIMPKKLVSDGQAAEPIVQCGNILGPKTPAGTGLVTVASLDLDTPLVQQTDVSVVGQEGLVYASPTSLYLTTARDYAFEAWDSGFWVDETSGIYKFDIESTPSQAVYLATGVAQGRMLNQFCLSEHNGFLRVATTTGSAGWWEDGNSLENHLIVFEQTAADLSVVGQIDGIGPQEEIYAARFLGDRGFMVTFFETDPLFTFDLTDPRNPKVVGEWQGPGFSTYLHPYGENLLISVGWEDGRTNISLYNLSNFALPTLVERQQLPFYSYETTALYEHKAFTFNPETGELLLPFYDWEGEDTGVLIYDISEANIGLRGTLAMGGTPEGEGPARRAMYNGPNVVGVSACRITSAPLVDPTQVISTLAIYEDACDFPGWWYF